MRDTGLVIWARQVRRTDSIGADVEWARERRRVTRHTPQRATDGSLYPAPFSHSPATCRLARHVASVCAIRIRIDHLTGPAQLVGGCWQPDGHAPRRAALPAPPHLTSHHVSICCRLTCVLADMAGCSDALTAAALAMTAALAVAVLAAAAAALAALAAALVVFAVERHVFFFFLPFLLCQLGLRQGWSWRFLPARHTHQTADWVGGGGAHCTGDGRAHCSSRRICGNSLPRRRCTSCHGTRREQGAPYNTPTLCTFHPRCTCM